METDTQTIEAAFQTIMGSDMFRLDGPEIDLPGALDTLADAVSETETDESTWCIGEFLECDLASLIIGAYWALTEWHDGGATYATLCWLGKIFSPGMTSGPEPDSSEVTAYEAVSEWFAKQARA